MDFYTYEMPLAHTDIKKVFSHTKLLDKALHIL